MGTHLYAASSFVFDGALTRHQKQKKARLLLDNVCDVNQRIQCFDEQCEPFSIRPLTLAILLADSKSVIDLLKSGAEVDYDEEHYGYDTPFNVVYSEMADYIEKFRNLRWYPGLFIQRYEEDRLEFLDCMKQLEIIQHHLHDEWWQKGKARAIQGSVLLPRTRTLIILYPVVSIPKQ